jgi:hypothetical protein
MFLKTQLTLLIRPEYVEPKRHYLTRPTKPIQLTQDSYRIVLKLDIPSSRTLDMNIEYDRYCHKFFLSHSRYTLLEI